MNEEGKFLLVLKALEIIEDGIANNLTNKAIKERVEEECGYERKYFNTIFKTYVKCSIAEYISTMFLLSNYRKWLADKKNLTKKGTYKGFEYFALYFQRKFGEELTEADEKVILSKAKLTKEKLQRLKFELEIFDLFRFYKLTEKGVEKMLKNNELLREFLFNYLTEYVEEYRDEFVEEEKYNDYYFIRDLEWNQYRMATSGFKMREVEFEVDEEKEMITGKAWVEYDVSACTTSFYFSEDEETRNFQLGEERTSASFYFDINYDKTNLAQSKCKIEIRVTPCY